ncbi:AAWKG family protein [Streptomyces sp. NPDC050264]|uniref:AAWKG family protein n=1 Tax=Streptomyces sp. NPDC050264 TaxID=3155038 RepID=UPI003433C3C9
MAGEYDKDSVGNVNEYEDDKNPTSDKWAALVKHITGWPVPPRSEIFDELQSDQGGKLFRMDFQKIPLSSLTKDRSASGFLMHSGEDYDLYFFDKDDKRNIKQARIVFEGRVTVDGETVFADPGSTDWSTANVRGGNDFTDYNDDKMSTIKLAKYMNGPRAALMALLNDGSTENARFEGDGVDDANVVDLHSFTTTGQSFDYAAQFFKDQAPVLKDWEDRFAADDASWKGEAANVFRSLLEKIRDNYDAYVETFNSSVGTGDETGTGKTVYSRALSLGRTYLENAARDLLKAWVKWANSPYYDPHQVLRYVLDDLGTWVDENNIAKTDLTVTGMHNEMVQASFHGDFSQVHDEYGDISEKDAWVKVGDRAVKIWSQGVNDYLGTAAATVQATLNNHFVDLSDDFSENVPKPKSTSTAASDYKDKKAEEAQDELDEANAKAAADAKKAADDAAKQAEDDKAYNDKLRDEDAKARADEKAYNEKLRDEDAKARADEKAYQEKLRADAAKAAEDQANALKDGLNGPGGGGNQTLDLNDLLNPGGGGGGQDGANNPGGGGQDGANNPGGGSTIDLGDLLNSGGNGTNNPATVSSTDLDDLLNSGGQNGAGSSGGTDSAGDAGGTGNLNDANSAVVKNLGNLGDVNSPSTGGDGGQLSTEAPPPFTNLGNLGGLNSGGTNSGAGTNLKSPTGGSTGLDDDKVTAGFPDGSSTAFDADSGTLTTTHPDGSTTTADLGNGAKVTNADGSVTSLGDDGRLTTTFPDGTVQHVDPATGQATTTDPDGTTTTQNLGSLGDLNSGGQNSLGDLGDLGDINSDLTTESPGDLNNLGDLGNLNGDQAGLQTPTGGHTALDSGDFTTTYQDGSSASFDPGDGQLTTTHPDGSSTVTDLTHGAKVTNPDGSSTLLDNGRLSTTFPDGSTQIIDPDTGVASITDPQGHTETVDLGALNSANNGGSDVLNGLNSQDGGASDLLDGLNTQSGGASDLLGDLNSQGGGGSDLLGDLNSQGSGGSDLPGGGTTGQDVSLSDLGLSNGAANAGGSGGGYAGDGTLGAAADGSTGSTGTGVDPLSDGTAATATGAAAPAAAATAGTPGAPGTPGSPGMPMGGAGGMGAGGGEKGNGERVRAVLVDAVEESERRNRRRRSPWNRQEDSDTFLSPASRVSTTGGGDSAEQETEPGRRTTTSADYLEEDTDVWGTEEGGTPAVIGR